MWNESFFSATQRMTFTFTLTQDAHVRAVQDVHRRTLAYKVSWAVLFYVSKGMAHFIPKDVIPPSDLVPLRQNLSRWVSGRTELHAETATA